MGYDRCMQEEAEEVEDRGSDRGEMEAGLQMDTGAVLLLTTGSEVVQGGVNCPLATLVSEPASLTGEPFFFTGLLTGLV